MSKTCMHCGCSVAWRSSRYFNRVHDSSTEEERKNRGIPYPEGEYTCAKCEWLLQNSENQCSVCAGYKAPVESWEGFKSLCQDCKKDMEEAISNINQEEWCCWTLSTDDITGIAKRKGISLAGKDIDDIARKVKKGIQWSLDEQWELIVANAILDSKAE